MRGGQPPLAPKSSHKVLRSFPPPHRLRGKPLKIPKKPRPPTVIPVLKPTVIAALDAAISFHIVCQVKPDNDKRGNDRAASIERSPNRRRGNPMYIPKCIFTTLVCKNKKNVAII